MSTTSMPRYSRISGTNAREIVLLKGKPCVWGKCAFCDYIADNCTDENACFRENLSVLNHVTGESAALEVINSASVFELDARTLAAIRDVVREKSIGKLFFECYYSYRHRLGEITDFFPVPVIFKCGIETFDDEFRNRVLKKGVAFSSVSEVRRYFQSVCIMVGIQGQTREMIARDIAILRENFPYGCVNVYCNNSTAIRQDDALIRWFCETYRDWDDYPNIDVLYHNTDFGVGV